MRVTGEGRLTGPAATSTVAATSSGVTFSDVSVALSSTPSASPAILLSATSSEVIIASPQPGATVHSPLTISGQAKGNWFFEATLPVRLEDTNGQVIASSPGQAQSDWMTTEFVPFTATLEFTTTATRGYLVISKDNPSGLPQNAASVKIPLNF